MWLGDLDDLMTQGSEFILSAYGVNVRVRSNENELLDAARSELRHAFAGQATIFDNNNAKFEHSYSVIRDRRGQLVLFLDGKKVTSGGAQDRFLRFSTV